MVGSMLPRPAHRDDPQARQKARNIVTKAGHK